jgi:hypothetical protein
MTKNNQEDKKPISFDVKQSVDQRPADFAIQETNKDGKHVSWTLIPPTETNKGK